MAGGYASVGAADARLYLRESELDQGARLVRAAYRALRNEALKNAEGSDLSEPEIDILVELLGRTDEDVTSLRNAMGTPKQSMARHLQSLEDKGLLMRKRCPKDGRRRVLILTDQGRDIASQAADGWRRLMAAAYVAVGPEDVANTRRLLAMLADSTDAGKDTP